jgi:hypothetical protein
MADVSHFIPKTASNRCNQHSACFNRELMRIRFSILLSAAFLVAAILLVFRDELHARGPQTECGYWGDMESGMSCR